METWPCTSTDRLVGSDLLRPPSWTLVLRLHQILLVEPLWEVDPSRLVSAGSDWVGSLLGLKDSVWAGCANQVTVIQESGLQTQVDQLSPRSRVRTRPWRMWL